MNKKSFYNILTYLNKEDTNLKETISNINSIIKIKEDFCILCSDKNFVTFNLLYKNKKDINIDEILLLKRNLFKKSIVENKDIVEEDYYLSSFNSLSKNYYLIIKINNNLEDIKLYIQLFKLIINHIEMKNFIGQHSNIDSLTGLYNFNYFQKILMLEMTKIDRIKENLGFSVILMDIEKIDEINEKYGFTFGDEILKYVAEMLKTKVRRTDEVFRLGNDEFAIIASYTDKDKVKESLLKRIETEISNKTFIINNDKIRIKLRYAVGEYKKGIDKQEFIKNLNKALMNKNSYDNIEYIEFLK